MKNQDFSNRRTEFFAANSKVVRTIPLGGKLKQLSVVMRGTLHVAAGGGVAGTALYAEAWAGLIQRIRVRLSKADGSRYPDGIVRDYDPRTILRRAMFYRHKYYADLLGTAFSDAVADYNLFYVFPIYFADPELKRPIETALNLDESAYKNCQVEIDCGSRDTCVTGSSRTWTYGDLFFDFIDDREAVDGDTYVVFETDHEIIINAAQQRYEDKAMPVDGSLLDIFIRTLTGKTGSTSVLVNTILNKLSVAGSNGDFELNALDLQAAMYDYGEIDVDQAVTGHYRLNFVRDGMLSKLVPAPGLQMHYDINNPSGAGGDSMLVSVRRAFQPAAYQPIARGVPARNT